MMPRVGDVAAIPLPGGGYGAVQISGITDDLTTAYSLDFYSDEQPDLAAGKACAKALKGIAADPDDTASDWFDDWRDF